MYTLNKAVGRLFLAKRKNKNSKPQTYAGEDNSRTVETKEQFVVATTHPMASMTALVHGEGESVRGGGGVSSG